MSETVNTHSSPLELDKALQYAVTLAWEDLMQPIEPRLVRVEYLCEPGTALDHLSVWSVRAGGYQDLVCDCWTWASVAHPRGAAFGNRHYSDKLAQTLDFVMKNQGQFTRSADAGQHGLVLIYTPDADDRREAANWMKGVQALGIEASLERARERPRGQAQHQDEQAWTSTDEEAHLDEHRATASGESAEPPAKASSANHFELRYAWPE
jgi:hypothetical protein